MNKRIEELAKQAGLMCLYDYGPEEDPHAMVVGQKDMELFAELIVRECAEVMRKNVNLNYDHCLDTKILTHFGVEQ